MTLDELKDTIKAMLEYMWDKELDDYLDTKVQDRSTHIFNTMMRLDGFLYGSEQTAEEFVEEAGLERGESGPSYDAATATGMYDHE